MDRFTPGPQFDLLPTNACPSRGTHRARAWGDYDAVVLNPFRASHVWPIGNRHTLTFQGEEHHS